MVLVHDTSSHSALQMCEVLSKYINSLLKDKISERSKLKALADDKIDATIKL